MDMEHRVEMEIVCLVSDILHNKGDSFAKELLEEQIAQGWEGMTDEADKICLKAGLPRVTVEPLSRKTVREAMEFHHMKTLKDEINKKNIRR